jgi:hypothetical protein
MNTRLRLKPALTLPDSFTGGERFVFSAIFIFDF